MATMLVTTGMRSARRAVGAAARHQQFAVRSSALLQMRSAVAVFPMTSGSSAASPLFMQMKLLSTSSSSSQPTVSSEDEDAEAAADIAQKSQEPVLMYEGPMSRAVRLMKGVSVTSCILTSIGMPTLCLISEQSTSMVGKWAMCGTIMLFGLGTTSLFHVLFKPYVMRMWLTNGERTQSVADPELTVETVTLFAQLTKHSFKLSDASPPASSMHPMLSFQAKGKNFFVHPEVFEDREFAEKLIGKKISAPRKDDDDDDDDE
ncbi:hypothetical protein Gpo141_00006604 [Globisporangium polare]